MVHADAISTLSEGYNCLSSKDRGIFAEACESAVANFSAMQVNDVLSVALGAKGAHGNPKVDKYIWDTIGSQLSQMSEQGRDDMRSAHFKCEENLHGCTVRGLASEIKSMMRDQSDIGSSEMGRTEEAPSSMGSAWKGEGDFESLHSGNGSASSQSSRRGLDVDSQFETVAGQTGSDASRTSRGSSYGTGPYARGAEIAV